MDEPVVTPQKWIQWARAIRHLAEQPSQQFGANLIAPVLTQGEELVQRLEVALGDVMDRVHPAPTSVEHDRGIGLQVFDDLVCNVLVA